VHTRRTTPNYRVTRHCSGLLCMGNGSTLHCCSPAASSVHTSCRRMVSAYREASQKMRTLPRRVTMMATLRGYLFSLIVRRPLGLQGTRGGPGAAPGWAAGAGAAGHVAASELLRAGQRELEPQGTWRPRSCPGLGIGSWVRRTRGGPRAAPDWAAGAGTAGHVVAPELPRAVRFMLRLTTLRGV
jgi:hypothetical protein